jgi:diacylglycerol kinase family enzyme
MMDGTKSEEKKRFGLLAYIWTMLKKSTIFQLHRYTLTIDGQRRRIRASEILISNTTLLEKPPFIFGPVETLHDGQVEVYVITAGNLGEYLRLVWDLIRPGGYNAAMLHHWEGRQHLRIETHRSPQLVQADGEVIGHTPVEIQIVPNALHVVMPTPASDEKGKNDPRIESTDAQLVSTQKTTGN